MRSNRQFGCRTMLTTLLLLAAAIPGLGQDTYEKKIQAWRADREEKLKAEDGWLTVSGLFWLREGSNEIGSSPANDIILPVGKAPDRIGSFELSGGAVTLRVAEGVTVTADGKPVRELALKANSSKPADVARIGDLSFLLLKRGERFAIRLKDKNSAGRREFTGLRWYPAKEAYQVTAQFIPYEQEKDVPIVNILGDVDNYKSPGLLKFKLQGQEFTLEPVLSGERLFIIFRDLTSNKTTYASARFLYADKPVEGRVVLDFNQAINPPCAFTAYATCPLPPRQNRLNTAIEAGELIYSGPSAKHLSAERK